MQDEYKTKAVIYDPLLSRPLRFIRSNICTFIKHCNSMKIIDLCCGTGEQLRMLSKEDLLLTGIDQSPAMLAIARKKSHASIHYLEADAASIPLPDSFFDIAILSFALHEKSAIQQTAIFNEAARLIQHKGYIVIADYATVPDRILSNVFGNIAIPLIERLAGINHYHNYRDWMRNGALTGFLKKENREKCLLIAPHILGCVQICAIPVVKKIPLQAILHRTHEAKPMEQDREVKDET